MWNPSNSKSSSSSSVIQGGDKICVQSTGLCGSVTLVRNILRGPYEGKRVGLTNAHLFQKKGDIVYMVTEEKNDKGITKAKRVGRVLDLDQIEDSAIFEIDAKMNSKADHIREIGAVSAHFAEVKEGEHVMGYSAVRGKCIEGVVTKVHSSATKGGNLSEDFEVQRIPSSEEVIEEGDSGMGWFNHNKEPLGYHFALFPHPGSNAPTSQKRSVAHHMFRACVRYEGLCPVLDNMTKSRFSIPPDARHH